MSPQMLTDLCVEDRVKWLVSDEAFDKLEEELGSPAPPPSANLVANMSAAYPWE